VAFQLALWYYGTKVYLQGQTLLQGIPIEHFHVKSQTAKCLLLSTFCLFPWVCSKWNVHRIPYSLPLISVWKYGFWLV